MNHRFFVFSLILFLFQMSFSRENLLGSYRIVEQLSQPIVNDGNETTKTSLSFLITDEKKKKSVLKLIDLESLNNLTDFIIKDILWYKQLNHSNLMTLTNCFLLDTKLCLIKPFATFGSCSDLLAQNPFGIRESIIALIIWQILQALRYLHDRHIMHRAVASKNIYVCENGRVLLDNFSHCISMISPFDGKLRRQLHEFTDELKDQILYLAPEVIFQNATGYNFKSDVYSLGTVACELANGSHMYLNLPFENLTLLYMKMEGSKPILLDETRLTPEMLALQDENDRTYVEELRQRRHSKEFHSFVESCVATQLEFRSSIDELQIHPFMKSPKKIYADPQVLADEMTKYFNSNRNDEKMSSNMSIEHSLLDVSSSTSNSLSISWEF